MQVGQLAFQQQVVMVGTTDVAGAARSGAGALYTGGGGAGEMPLLVLIVTMVPGSTAPVGVVPTTVPFAEALLICADCAATSNPASRMRFLAASRFRPTTLGIATLGAPLR